MPELPEVETIAAGLRRTLVGKEIDRVRLSLPKLVRGPASGLRRLEGRAVAAVRRRGKHLILECGEYGLIVHLRMTGCFFWAAPGERPGKHTHMVFRFRGPGRELHFEDVRKFGFVRVVRCAEAEGAPELAGLGPEPLEIGREEFRERLKTRRGRVKSVLLDQSFLAGIGNIYADEMLHAAGIHPLAPARRLSSVRAGRLWEEMRGVLGRAVAAGGSSIRDYRDADGEMGSFQTEHRVYGRAGRPCLRCGRQVRRTVVGGRSTHFCPLCQREKKAGPLPDRKTGREKSSSTRSRY